MGVRFELPAELNIYGVLDVRDSLLAWVSAQGANGREVLEISARDVAEVDGAGLQLLAALSNMDTPWRLVDASEIFQSSCRTLGLADWLDPRYLKAI